MKNIRVTNIMLTQTILMYHKIGLILSMLQSDEESIHFEVWHDEVL